jgi:beta-hydroxylase
MTVRISAFRDAAQFEFVPALEAEFAAILAEVRGLAPEDFGASPDSLTRVADGYDETGWLACELYGDSAAAPVHRERCPETARACAAVPGMVHASFSLFRPGTHLYPHRGEREGVLRCHLPLVVPRGDVALCAAGERREWRVGQCLVFDDTIGHEAWNRGDGDRIVLIVTFEAQR